MTTTTRTGEPRLASLASWAVLTASFGLSASTWIALAVLAGFTAHLSVAGLTLRMAWLMPIAVDGYVVVALVLWMAPVPAKVAAFAKKNTYLAATIGIAAQSAYHLLFTLSTTTELWRVVLAAVVGALPPAVAALAVHMRALIRRESTTTTTSAVTATRPAATQPQPSTHTTTDTEPASPAAPAVTEAPAQAAAPAQVPASAAVPTPAQVATRITPARPTTPPAPPAAVPVRTARPPSRTNKPATTATTLAPSTADHKVTESDAAQLALPLAPDLLAEAARVAKQYRREHGVPITRGQLAVRLKVTSEEAAQALALLDLNPNNPTGSTAAVNGNRPKGTTR